MGEVTPEPGLDSTVRDQDEARVKLPRWPKPVLLIVCLGLVAAVGASGLLVGYKLRSSTEEQIQAAAAPVLVTAHVQYQTEQLDPVNGTIGSVATYQYLPVAAHYPGQMVVTKLGPSLGQPLLPGGLITSIDDVPVFGLPLTVTLWRDLALNDTGTDVAGLNSALKDLGYLRGHVADVYSAETAAAVAKLFAHNHFVAPSTQPSAESSPSAGTIPSDSANSTATTPVATVAGNFLPTASIANFPNGTLLVTQAAPVGTVIVAGQPALTASGPVNTIVTKIDILHQQKLTVGTAVALHSVAGKDLGPGTITTIGVFTAGDSTKTGADQLNGYPISVSFTSPPAAAPKAASTDTAIHSGDQVQIQFPNLADSKLAVPTVAVRQSIGSTKVLLKHGSTFRTVPVTVLWQQGGWSAIAATQGITDGDIVVVSGK